MVSSLTNAEQASEKHPLAAGDLVAALIVVALGALTFGLVLKVQQFGGSLYAGASAFVFPVPVACGLACGFVAPRRSVVWGVLWACILSGIIFTVLSSSINGLLPVRSPWRVPVGLVGMTIAVLSAVGGKRAVDRGHLRKVTLVLFLLCGLTVVAGYLVARSESTTYSRHVLPMVIVELDASYMDVPLGAVWRCRVRRDLGCYELESAIDDQRIVVFADREAPLILGIDFLRKGPRPEKWDCAAAQAYLSELGFRAPIVKSVLQRRGERGPWFGGIDFTRIVLTRNGTVTLRPYPPFESRAVGSHRH